jgi:alcohol dehydrogenase
MGIAPSFLFSKKLIFGPHVGTDDNLNQSRSDQKLMQVVCYNNHGTIEMVEISFSAKPIPKKGEALVEVYAFGLNPIDLNLLKSAIPSDVPIPKIIGCELSGRVISTEQCCTDHLLPGDYVVSMIPPDWGGWGAASEYVSIAESLLAKVPPNTNVIDAAGIPYVGLTVIQALEPFVRSQHSSTHGTLGKKILIQEGANGIGPFAIQYCKNVLGMYVITTCSTHSVSLVRHLGADEVIDVDNQRYRKGHSPLCPPYY